YHLQPLDMFTSLKTIVRLINILQLGDRSPSPPNRDAAELLAGIAVGVELGI
ncbi:hypothetical protein ACJX0J_037618, partial [Zea mays]